jgi:hypothetical protein
MSTRQPARPSRSAGRTGAENGEQKGGGKKSCAPSQDENTSLAHDFCSEGPAYGKQQVQSVSARTVRHNSNAQPTPRWRRSAPLSLLLLHRLFRAAHVALFVEECSNMLGQLRQELDPNRFRIGTQDLVWCRDFRRLCIHFFLLIQVDYQSRLWLRASVERVTAPFCIRLLL